MTHTSASAPVRPPQRPSAADWVGLGVLALLLVVGLSWSKWLPYWDKTLTLSQTSLWEGSPLFDAAGDSVSLSGAWEFTLVYFTAVWKALLVALPALSIPSMVMVGKAMGWKTTAAMGATVAVAAVLAGGALALLS